MELKDHIETFFSSVRAWGDAIGDPGFVFAAVKNNGRYEITQARLLVGTIAPFTSFGFFRTENVQAGHFLLKDVGLGAEQYLEKILEGICPTPWGEAHFPGNNVGEHGGYYQPFHQDGLARSERIGVLTVFGSSLGLQPNLLRLDWELKGADEPFDSLQELYNRFRLGPLRADVATIEVAALGVLAVDLSKLAIFGFARCFSKNSTVALCP